MKAVHDQPTDDEFGRFVGHKAAYYRSARYGQLAFKPNWGAFFFAGFWFFYRKMYTTGAAILSLVGLLIVAVQYYYFVVVGLGALPVGAGRTLGIAQAVTLGFIANPLYVRHVRQRIAAINTLHPFQQDRDEAFAKEGGTSALSAAAAFVIFVVCLMALHGVLFARRG